LLTLNYRHIAGFALRSYNCGQWGKIAQPSIEIELFSSWGYEEACGGIPVSKTFFVPAADPLDGRVNTSLAACLEGGETLMPAESIAPLLGT
jgi:hypothetical protein